MVSEKFCIRHLIRFLTSILLLNLCVQSFSFLAEARERLAIVGAGASGLITAWLLEKEFDVTVFEKADRIGGHAETIDIPIDGKNYPIDAGFEFFSRNEFPFYWRFLQILNVQTRPFDLTYTFYTPKYDQNGNRKKDKVIVFTPYFDHHLSWPALGADIGHLTDLVQFRILVSYANKIFKQKDQTTTVEEFVERTPFLTRSFKTRIAYPFFAAGWGVSQEVAKTFITYNMLKGTFRNISSGISAPPWEEIVGGTSVYIDAMAKQMPSVQIKTGMKITSITHPNQIYEIDANGETFEFEHVVMATPANRTYELLSQMTGIDEIKDALSKVEYYHTSIAIHGDPSFMPRKKSLYSVTNVRFDGTHAAMTIYKHWLSPESSPIFRSWIYENVERLPNPLYKLIHYEHAKLDKNYVNVQRVLRPRQGINNLWFAGVYTYDLDNHESAISSSITVAQKLDPQSARLHELTEGIPLE